MDLTQFACHVGLFIICRSIYYFGIYIYVCNGHSPDCPVRPLVRAREARGVPGVACYIAYIWQISLHLIPWLLFYFCYSVRYCQSCFYQWTEVQYTLVTSDWKGVLSPDFRGIITCLSVSNKTWWLFYHIIAYCDLVWQTELGQQILLLVLVHT